MVGPIELVKRGIVAPKHWGVCLAWSLAAVAIPVLLRLAIDRGDNGFPFATFLPAILWVSIFLDWRFATLTAFGSLVAVGALFVHPVFLAHPTWERGVLFLLYLLTVASMILTGHVLRRAVLDLEARSNDADAFNADLQHRARNALQVVKALASRASRSTDPAEFYKTLGGRITALIKANDLLGMRRTASCELKDLVAGALQEFPSSRIAWSGPSCVIGREAGAPLMMALHELATNAAKHGALSNEAGRIALEWQPVDAGGEIDMIWWESGGPPVEPPKTQGLGARILSPQGGLRKAEVEYDPAGVRCRLTVKAEA
jgi:two-component sensor histidine kinase